MFRRIEFIFVQGMKQKVRTAASRSRGSYAHSIPARTYLYIFGIETQLYKRLTTVPKDKSVAMCTVATKLFHAWNETME